MQFFLDMTNKIHPSNTETQLMTRVRQGCLLLEQLCVGAMYIFLDILFYDLSTKERIIVQEQKRTLTTSFDFSDITLAF